MPELSDAQLIRYSRQWMLEAIGEAGQRQLARATVLLVGMGGLGCAAAPYLAAAGVGRLVLADFDRIEASNLPRQLLYDPGQEGQPKVSAAKARLSTLSPECRIRTVERRMDDTLLGMEVAMADLVLDCTDNLASRHAINRACFRAGVPLIMGAAIGFSGQLALFDFRKADAPCYQCLYPSSAEAPRNCQSAGVLGPVVGTIGSLQALEALKLLAGIDSGLDGRLLLFDGLAQQWQRLALRADPACAVCASGGNPSMETVSKEKQSADHP